MNLSGSGGRTRLLRARWAAIGAAVAVSIGGGGLFVANAASGPASSVVMIDPVRILDTRTDVGLPGPFVSPVSQKLQVTGAAVPAGATGVLLNTTVVGPTADGFLSIRPGDASGAPSTSSLNFKAGEVVPNSVQVGLPTSGATAGQIDITYDALGVSGPKTEVLIDVVGYLVAGGGGGSGPAVQAGPAGTAGPKGDTGAPGGTGPRGLSAWDVIPTGVTVTGAIVWDSHTSGRRFVDTHLRGPARYRSCCATSANVNFASAAATSSMRTPHVTGPSMHQPLLRGKVCIYLSASGGIDTDPATVSAGKRFSCRPDPSRSVGYNRYNWSVSRPFPSASMSSCTPPGRTPRRDLELTAPLTRQLGANPLLA